MNTTQQPEALNLEEFRAKVTHAAREPLLARIAELEAQLSAIGAGGVEPLRKPASQQAVQAAVSVAHRHEFTDGHRTLKQDVFSAIHDYAATKPEQDPDDPESWESWFEAAFDLLGTRVGQIFEEHAERSAPAHPAEGATAQTGAYAEARECEHCNHVGINDAANGIASCTACKWNGDSPKEDKCPDCEAEGTMTASCPKCHHEYRLIADATLAATQAAPQAVQAAVPVAGQSRFKGEKDWHWCSPEHVAMVAATPSEWQGYEARYLYAHAAPAHPAEGVPAQAAALLATGGQAQAVERIAIDMKQTAELLDLFGGEPTEFTVMQCNGHSGPGLYAYVTEYPEDGASYLGKTDCEAQPAPKAQAAASTAGHGLEQFIEQVGDVHFQRCRVGSKEGAIRWDIEFGHYGDEVRGKTLREAITKAITAQAKQGEQE